MSKPKLEKHELEHIKRTENGLSELMSVLKDVSRFKEGDFLIAFRRHSGYHGDREVQVTNSYGAPKKFQVVAMDKHGLPYMKELNKKGEPTGTLIQSVRIDGGYGQLKHGDYRFEVDPDYVDSIVMMDEENYDASSIHRQKGDLFKEITKHNKSIKVKVNDTLALISFLQTLKVGDVLWKSIKTNITITKIDPIPLTHRNSRIDDYKDFGTATDSKGKVHTLNSHFFKWGAFYTAQPRSYNELKDPK